jgi:uncharacterized protein with von Willebrand factor type A (vWA) domain
VFRHPSGFAPDSLDQPIAALDALPRGLWLPGIVNAIGKLPRRLAGIDALRRALLDGALPQPWSWPAGGVLAAFRETFVALDLPRYCLRQEDVTAQVLRSLLWHTDRIVDYRDQGDDEPQAVQRAARKFHDDWRRTSGEMDELIEVFGDLGDALQLHRWDATRGRLHGTGWQEVLRIRRLLEQLPEMCAVIRRLGRSRMTDEADESHEMEIEIVDETTALVPQQRQLAVPDLPGETRGVERSGSIARMLPSEAVLLRHPKLRLIWFARHAERTLLSYEEQEVLCETVMAERRDWRPTVQRRPERRLELGPIIVCVDTSGSMQGEPEQVAKAVVLEAMRTAHAQKRPCRVFSFGGPGEVVERELPVDDRGIGQAIEFLNQSFHGGTDISEPLEQAMARIVDAPWRHADLLIASDGEFGAVRTTVERVRAAKREQGLRIQGILIGDRETIGMLEVCDDIFWVHDWRRFGSGAASPVHSKSLTALYFPNALR